MNCTLCALILKRTGFVATFEAGFIRYEPDPDVRPVANLDISARDGEITISDGMASCSHRFGGGERDDTGGHSDGT